MLLENVLIVFVYGIKIVKKLLDESRYKRFIFFLGLNVLRRKINRCR